jgi:hypothetical protein
MLLLLVRLLLLVLVLMAMWLTPSTLLTQLFGSLLCLPCVQLLMSSTRASRRRDRPTDEKVLRIAHISQREQEVS